MKALMVAGTSSWAGKSLVATALCAALRNRGMHVAPFKAQNMSNNARVVSGGEIGCAQYFQALAAGVEPTTDHNPVLLKPESDTSSQVVVNGQVDWEATRMPWRERAPLLWGAMTDAYDRVASSNDVVILEGAGSPAEINLADVDLVNMRMARYADAEVAIVCDIDRGGAFAHLYGTWSLLSVEDRKRVVGFILNKFRGDATLLEPGPSQLRELTGVPTLGVIPMVDHGLPDEDGADPRPRSSGGMRVRVVRGPAASNLDEWWPLLQVSDFSWATAPHDLSDAELIVVPGSKQVVTDLAWLRTTGLSDALAAAHRRNVPILAVCGGVQMLGGTLTDPHGVEFGATGLGLLPATTTLAAAKRVRRHTATFATDMIGPWKALSGRPFTGYEIHFGATEVELPAVEVLPGGMGWSCGNILAVYSHGLAEDPGIVAALTGSAPSKSLQDVFDGLADLIESSVDIDRLLRIAEQRP
jgi:adenosylcobyric acid synthase